MTIINSCPFTVTLPGDYHVGQDLTCPGGGITINADNTNLYLDGHTIDGVSEGSVGIYSTGSTVNISGPGTVMRFSYGIELDNNNHNTVLGITATNNNFSGILARFSNNGTVRNCTANNNGQIGIFVVYGAGSNSLMNNTTSGNVYGILVESSDNNTLVWNTAVHNRRGIAVYAANKNQVVSNTADSNSELGIWLFGGSSNNFIVGNLALQNGTYDGQDNYPNCDSNIWANLLFTKNQFCVH